MFTGLPADALSATAACALASVGDGLLVLLIWGTGVLVFGQAAWVRTKGWRRWMLLVILAIIVGIVVEIAFVHGLGKWGYRDAMPLLPLIRVGLVPVLLFPLFAPPILWWASRPRGGRPCVDGGA
jgi:hypothetical protein